MWQDFLSSFLELFLKAVLPVLAAALAGVVIALVNKAVEWFKSKLNLQMQFILNEAAKSAVLAAEQVKLSGVAIEKKDYAIDYATRWLSDRGYKIDLATLADAIEAAVMSEFNRSKVQ